MGDEDIIENLQRMGKFGEQTSGSQKFVEDSDLIAAKQAAAKRGGGAKI